VSSIEQQKKIDFVLLMHVAQYLFSQDQFNRAQNN